MDEIPADVFLFKVSNGITKIMDEICSKLVVKILERCSVVFIVNFEQISLIPKVVRLLILNK